MKGKQKYSKQIKHEINEVGNLSVFKYGYYLKLSTNKKSLDNEKKELLLLEEMINKVNEDIYYEKLDNGLEVYFYINPTIHNNDGTYTTKYGSIYKEFTPINEDKMINVPNGIAHFLEHKVFVQEIDPQPEEFFAQNGALCNAYTTFKNTTYLFSGPDNLKENIIYLLDYVSSLYLTEKNVESEKDIII